jgi:pilus assembly protein CpaC
MVYLKLQIMEFKKNALENLGVDWQTNIAGPAGALTFDLFSNKQFRFQGDAVDPTFDPGKGALTPLAQRNQPTRAYLGIASVITSRINLAVSNGDAWILASPELSTRSGGEAKFLAGGQVPLPTVSATGQSNVTFKDYGIRLLIKPVTDDNDNIMAVIQTELSAIDPSVSVQGIPGFTTRVTDSEINLKSGQTIVISGLLSQDLNNVVNKVPLLGDLPVLGNLFKSTNFRSGRTDLVIFVTPTVTDPASTQNRQRLDKARDLRDRFESTLGNKGIVD